MEIENRIFVEKIEKLCFSVLAVVNEIYDFYSFSSAAVAASIIFCVRKVYDLDWSVDMQKLTFFSKEQIEQCSEYMWHIITQDERFSHLFQEHSFLSAKSGKIDILSTKSSKEPQSELKSL